MKKIHQEMVEKWSELNDTLKDTICNLMKEAGCIKLKRAVITVFQKDNEYIRIPINSLEYDEQEDDVMAYGMNENMEQLEFSIQQDGVIDGLLDLLYDIENYTHIQ